MTGCLGAALLVWTGVSTAHDVVSGAASGMPLPPSPIMAADQYAPLDVSDDGRYVLFANYSPDETPDIIDVIILNQAQCNIYRKDRATGNLDLVFQSSAESGRYFCRGAMMSADGNVIMAQVLSEPDNPVGELVDIDGTIYASFGDVVTLVVADMNSNTTTDIKAPYFTNNANDIARINLGQGFGGLPVSLYRLETLSADGTRAIVSRFNFSGRPLYDEVGYVDIASSQVEFGFLPANGFSVPTTFVQGLSLSSDGQTLLIPLPYFSSTGNGVFSPATQAVWLYDFGTGMADEVIELREDQPPAGTGLRTFGRHSLSTNAGTISWVRGPAICSPGFTFPAPPSPVNDQPDFCDPETALPVCEGEDCELTFSRIDLATREISHATTLTDPDGSTPGFTNAVKFSADGSRALYPRLVREPFGEGFRTRLFDREPLGNDNFVCANRDSIDSGSGVPVIEPCTPSQPGPIRPENGGPIIGVQDYTDYESPVLWVIKDFNRNQEIVVSAHDGQLFQSSSALLSGDGGTVAFSSRDSRLRNPALFAQRGPVLDDPVVAPAALPEAFSDDSMLDPACFWPAAGNVPNLRIATNDNVRFFTAPTQYVYEAAPVFCPAPTPVHDGHVFAADVAKGRWPWSMPGRVIFVEGGENVGSGVIGSDVTRNFRRAYVSQLRSRIRTALFGERATSSKGATAQISER